MGGFANNAPIVTDGLVFYVDAGNSNSYPGSGGTWSDLVGGNDGTLTNGPTFDSANGGSIVFDGVDDYIEGGVLDNGGGTGSAQSYGAWFKVDALATNDVQGLFFWSNANGIAIGSGSFGGVDNEIFIQTSGDNSIGDFTTTPTVSANTWCNVVFNFTQGVSYECWVDGVSLGSVATTDTSPAPAAENYKIGSRMMTGGNPTDYANGNIAIVQAYNRALSDSEVLQNYNALKNRFV